MAIKNFKAKNLLFHFFLAHLSPAWVDVCTCAQLRSKIQCENWQPQKKLEHLLKEAFEPDAAALEGRKPACNLKKKKKLTLQFEPLTQFQNQNGRKELILS